MLSALTVRPCPPRCRRHQRLSSPTPTPPLPRGTRPASPTPRWIRPQRRRQPLASVGAAVSLCLPSRVDDALTVLDRDLARVSGALPGRLWDHPAPQSFVPQGGEA
jgi:hypothetical protein